MDILVSIPYDKREHIMATKLNPISGLSQGWWTLSGCPRFAKRGDRIWFSIFGEVIASAKITYPKSEYPKGYDRIEDGEGDDANFSPAVEFDIPTAQGHEFGTPRELSIGFRGFRYVRRASKHTNIRYTKSLELVGAQEAKRLHPRNW